MQSLGLEGDYFALSDAYMTFARRDVQMHSGVVDADGIVQIPFTTLTIGGLRLRQVLGVHKHEPEIDLPEHSTLALTLGSEQEARRGASWP
jgi:hypothetical protein